MLISYRYRLRASAPMENYQRNFILQTFGAEKTQIDIYTAKTQLLRSSDMWGQGGNFTGASYQRLNYLNESCQQVFQGQEEHKPDFMDEDSIPWQ